MVNWDDSLDKRLLLTIIHVAAPSAIDYKKVAALMGSDFSISSIQQRYTKKLKKEAEENFGALDAGGEGGVKTPVKKTPAKKAAGEKASTGKRKAKKAAGEDDEVEKDDEESPSKKVKREEKQESGGEDEV